VPQRVPESVVQPNGTTRASERLATITQQILSRTELEKIIQEFDLYNTHSADTPADASEWMRTHDIEIRPLKGDAFRLGFAADRPEVAKGVVDRLVSLFIVQSSADQTIAANGTDQFLEVRLAEARKKLVDNEAQLAEYRRHHNGELPTQLDANVRGLHDTELQLQVVAESLNRDRDRQLALDRSIKDAGLAELLEKPAKAEATVGTAATPTAAQQLERAEAALKRLQTTLTDQHPDVVALRQNISELRKRAEAEGLREVALGAGSPADILRRRRVEELRAELAAVTNQIAQKTAESDRLRGLLVAYHRRIESAPAREAEIAALTRDYDTLQQTYRGLLAKKQESEIAADLERRQIGAHFKVLDPAALPTEPFAPNRERLYAAAVVAAFILSTIFALVLEQFRRGLRTQDEEIATLGLPVLAVIPLVAPRRRWSR